MRGSRERSKQTSGFRLDPRLVLCGLFLGVSCAQRAAGQDASAAPQTPKVVRIVRTEVAPVIDGRIDEAAWSRAAVIEDLHQIQPTEYVPFSEPTYVYLLYDENALYVAARMAHRDPATMKANILRQGEFFFGDDLFAVMLDPFNDKRSGYRFQVNANGVRMEALYQDTTRQLWDWNGIWDAEATQDEAGWSAEIAIPFKTLSFDPQTETWGLNFRRDIGYNDERAGWVSHNRTQDPSNSGALLGLDGLELGRGLDVVPSISLRETQDFSPLGERVFDAEPSLDLFYKISPALNGSLTFNTDFSATEVDDRQVNLTRFDLFFPEKRDFFLRDADIFRFGRLGVVGTDPTNTGGSFPRPTLENGQPFFSRRIGLSAAGEPVDLNYGAKLSGRLGRWNIGTLAIHQEEFAGVNGSDLFVGRIAANVLEESSLGLIVTDGDPRSNLANSVVGVDFRYFNARLRGGRTLEGEAWAQRSKTEGVEGNDGAWGVRLRSPNTSGIRGGLGIKELQADFNPALGFVNRSGIHDQTGELGYTWRFRHPYMRLAYSGIDAQRIELLDGGLQTELMTLRMLEIDSNRRDRFILRHHQTKEVLREPFPIWEREAERVVIEPGDYSFDETEVSVTTGPQRKFFGNLNIRSGDFYDGERLRLGGKIGWRPSPHFMTSVEYQFNDVELPDGNFSTRLVQFRADIVFSATLSWVTLVQYDNITETVGINSRVHWVPEAGREAFIVLNHNLTDLDRNNSFESAAADLTLKYSYTFRF